jgi:hypothetical protein
MGASLSCCKREKTMFHCSHDRARRATWIGLSSFGGRQASRPGTDSPRVRGQSTAPSYAGWSSSAPSDATDEANNGRLVRGHGGASFSKRISPWVRRKDSCYLYLVIQCL